MHKLGELIHNDRLQGILFNRPDFIDLSSRARHKKFLATVASPKRLIPAKPSLRTLPQRQLTKQVISVLRRKGSRRQNPSSQLLHRLKDRE